MQSEWVSVNKMHAANTIISKVISLWFEETLLYSTASKRNNDNLQPKLNNYFTYQTPDSAENFTETKQKKRLKCNDIYGYSNLINCEQWFSSIMDPINSFVREKYLQFISPLEKTTSKKKQLKPPYGILWMRLK